MIEYTRSVEFQVGDRVVTPDGEGDVVYVLPAADTFPTLIDVQTGDGTDIFADFELTLVAPAKEVAR